MPLWQAADPISLTSPLASGLIKAEIKPENLLIANINPLLSAVGKGNE